MKRGIYNILVGLAGAVAAAMVFMYSESFVRCLLLFLCAYWIFDSAIGIIASLLSHGTMIVANIIKAVINIALSGFIFYFASNHAAEEVTAWVFYVIGIDLILSSILPIIAYFRAKGLGYVAFFPVRAIISIIFAVFIFSMPAFMQKSMFVVVGIMLSLFSLSYILSGIFLIASGKTVRTTVIEAEYREER